jgi:hypothetical protein
MTKRVRALFGKSIYTHLNLYMHMTCWERERERERERDGCNASESAFWKEHMCSVLWMHMTCQERKREREMAAMQVRGLFGESTCV